MGANAGARFARSLRGTARLAKIGASPSVPSGWLDGQQTMGGGAQHRSFTVSAAGLASDRNAAATSRSRLTKKWSYPDSGSSNQHLTTQLARRADSEGRAAAHTSRAIQLRGKITRISAWLGTARLEHGRARTGEKRAKADPDHQTRSGKDSDPTPGPEHRRGQSMKKSGSSSSLGSTA